MLSAPIQSSTNAPLINSTGNPLAPAVAVNSAAATTEAHNSPEKKSAADVESEVFSGQLNDVLNNALISAEPVATDVTGEQLLSPVVEQQSLELQTLAQPQNQEQQPNPEAWLQAMLDQQQLQLAARDSAASVTAEAPVAVVAPVASTGVPSPTNATTLTPTQKTVSAIALEKFSNATLDASNASISGTALNQEAIQADRAAPSAATDKVFTSVTKVISNPSAMAVVANAVPADEARTADASNTANSSATVSSSAANVVQLASAVLNETGANESMSSALASTALTTSGSDSAQRVQTQLNLHAPEAKWGEQLLHTLRDNVQVQIQQKIQNATIRLDPPELGSLEIYISHESGRLHVQITASQADVARLIQHTSDRLRQELSGPQFTQVNIQTSAEGQSGQQQSRERQRFVGDELILANEQAFVGSDQQTKRPDDVLVTV